MHGVFNNITIKGIKTVAPTQIVDNIDFVPFLGERRCKKQIKLTGVRKRHVSVGRQTSTDLVGVAARELLNDLQWNPLEIDVLVFLTQSPKFMLPSSAFFLQHILGLSKECMVFDVNLGCTGALEGIQIAASILQPLQGNRRGLVVMADTVYKANPATYKPDLLADLMLFGSAGVAVAVEKMEEETANKLYFANFSDGNRYKALIKEKGKGMEMDGTAIFDFGVNEVARDLREFKKHFDIDDNQVDFYSFHQAQKLMLDTIIADCGIPEEKELRSLTEFGNTSGASLMVNYCYNRELINQYESFNTIMCGFGVGLSWTYMYTKLESNCVKPIVFSDEFFED